METKEGIKISFHISRWFFSATMITKVGSWIKEETENDVNAGRVWETQRFFFPTHFFLLSLLLPWVITKLSWKIEIALLYSVLFHSVSLYVWMDACGNDVIITLRLFIGSIIIIIRVSVCVSMCICYSAPEEKWQSLYSAYVMHVDTGGTSGAERKMILFLLACHVLA